MIQIEQTEVVGWGAAIRGMRNPMNSWDKSDSHICDFRINDCDCPMVFNEQEPAIECNDGEFGFCIGENDYALMKKLAKAGTDHRKFMRMIVVYCDITAPLYWWKEFDTYKVGTVANSCSTMHKIHSKELTLDDFSWEYLTQDGVKCILEAINQLNFARTAYIESKDKSYFNEMIQLLPTSYNQKRTVMMNYEVLANIYNARKNHKLDEWRELCKWIEALPYSCLMTGKDGEPDG